MKIVHCGDIHIKIPEKNEKFYIQRFLDFAEKISEEEPDELVICGDVFDKAPTALETALMLGWIQSFDCPTYVIEGNHDRVNRKSERANFLGNLLTLMNFPNVIYAGPVPIEVGKYLMISNRLIREGYKITPDKNLILLSHIRHELDIAGTTKKAEYDMKELEGFKLCLLSDIHSTFKYSKNIFYSSSPWRTHKKTISSIKDIDDSFFGYNILEDDIISHVECNLPNHYVLKTSEKVANINYAGIVDIEYEISMDELDNFKGESIKIKHEDSDIEVSENLYELVYSILEEEYSIKEPKKYMDLLVDIVGDLSQ